LGKKYYNSKPRGHRQRRGGVKRSEGVQRGLQCRGTEEDGLAKKRQRHYPKIKGKIKSINGKD